MSFWFWTLFKFAKLIVPYLESTFMPMDYGVLNGDNVNWNHYTKRAILDALLWIIYIVISIIVFYSGKIKHLRVAVFISVLLIVVQATALFYSVSTIPQKPYILTETGKFSLSAKDNIIIIILDSYDNTIFEEVINKNLNYQQSFKDFTFYSNCTSAFNYTVHAVPYLLTGIPYDNSITYDKYINKCYEDCELLKTLYDNNYDNRLFTYSYLLPLNNPKVTQYISNAINISSTDSAQIAKMNLLIPLMYKFTATRYFPLVLKPFVWLHSDEFENVKNIEEAGVPFEYLEKQNRDLNFWRVFMKNGFTLIHDKNAFRVYHLKGLHYPYNLKETMDLTKNNYTKKGLLSQAEAELKIVIDFINKLKELNVYDNSTIILTADHGRVMNRRMAIGYSPPLLLIKANNQSHKTLKISESPVCTGDIPDTILSIIGKQTETSIMSINENSKRIRYYYANSHLEQPELPGYSSNFYEFRNDGHAMDINAWNFTGRIYAPTEIRKWKPTQYVLGTNLTFDKGGNGYDYVTYGLLDSSAEVFYTEPSNFAFTTGQKTELSFELPKIDTDVTIYLDLAPVSLSNQIFSLKVVANGVTLKNFLINGADGRRTIRVKVPFELVQDRMLHMQLLHPDTIDNTIVNPDSAIFCEKSFKIYSICIN